MLEHGSEERGREASCDEAADHGLRDREEPVGQARRAAARHQEHRGAHRTEKKRRGQTGDVEDRD
jgi:hypothetical protein